MANGAGIAYAGQDLTQAIRQMLIDRMAQQKQAQSSDIEARDMALRESDSAQRAKYQDATLAETARNHSLEDQARQEGRVIQGVNLRPIGATVTGPEYQKETGMGIGSGMYAPQELQEPTPPDALAADLNAKPLGMIRGTIANSPSPNARQYTNLGTQDAQAKAAAVDQHASDARDSAQAKVDAAAKAKSDKQDNLRLAASLRPASDAGWVVQDMTDASGKPIKVRVNSHTGQVKPVTLPEGVNAAKASTPNRQIERQQKAADLASGDVTAALDQVDAAEKQGLLGPSAGRYYGQFLAGTVGSTGDPAADQRLGGLRAAIKDLNTSYSMAISGTARGGGGATDRLNSVLNSDKFSADLMRGALHEISGALARRAKPDDAKTGTKLTADELLKKYGG